MGTIVQFCGVRGDDLQESRAGSMPVERSEGPEPMLGRHPKAAPGVFPGILAIVRTPAVVVDRGSQQIHGRGVTGRRRALNPAVIPGRSCPARAGIHWAGRGEPARQGSWCLGLASRSAIPHNGPAPEPRDAETPGRRHIFLAGRRRSLAQPVNRTVDGPFHGFAQGAPDRVGDLHAPGRA